MKISLAGLVLADASARLPPQDLKLNGVRVVELVDFARAAAKGVFSRGNAATTLVFSVSRQFDSYADAQDAFFQAESAAPVSGALLIQQTGAVTGRPPLGATTAVLTTIVPTILGVQVDFLYTIQAGRIVGGAALPYLSDPDASSIMLGSTPIPAGQNYVAVAFPANLDSPIIGGLSIVAPTGADSPGIWKVEQVTEAGFVCYFTGAVPAAGYALHWTAKAGASD